MSFNRAPTIPYIESNACELRSHGQAKPTAVDGPAGV